MSLTHVIALLIACAGAALLALGTSLLVRAVGRRHPYLAAVDRRCRKPWTLTLVSAAALTSLSLSQLHGDTAAAVRHVLLITVIAAVTWLLTGVACAAEDAAFRRLRIDVGDNRKARKLRTQIGVIRRVVVAVLVIVGASAILMTFARMRTLGASLLASAGVAGIVGGLAAQTTLGNVFAGLQLAFTDALRFDDVVVVDQQWGRVENLSLTFVVVRLWDERRLVLPTTYFTTQPFENWTRSTAQVTGTVLLHLDYRAPVPELRAETERYVQASPLWDRRSWALQVTDCTDRTVEVRIIVSAADAGRAFDLRCALREHLIGWLNAHHPEALPTLRLESDLVPVPA